MVVPMAAPAEDELVHEKVVPDQKRRLHGLRGNLKCLNDEGRAKQGQNHGDKEGFDILSHRRVPHSRLARFLPWQYSLQSPAAPNCFSAARAAPCSASFFDRPVPTAVIPPVTQTSTRKVFSWSRPLSATMRYLPGSRPRACRNSWRADL